MFRILSLFGLMMLFLGQYAFGQSYTDALRYSQFEVGGTARTIGIGGGIGALGADFSTLSTNPAGLGMYRRSEFVITPSFFLSTVEANLINDGQTPVRKEDRANFNVNSLGVVVASKPTNSNFTTFNFGVGFNRLGNFNQQFYYEGQSTGSIVNRFQELANGSDQLDNFESGVAVDAFALYDLEPQDGFYESDFELDTSAIINREQLVESNGSITELVFGLAGNYNEKVILGLTIGVPFLSFTEEKVYSEFDDGDGPDGNLLFFDDLQYRENLTTTGIGINLKLGVIYRINQMFRLGAAVHTPTGLRLEDSFSTSLIYNYTDDNGPTTGEATSPDGLFDYRLRTPWRFIGSGGVLFKKFGFLTAEVEYVNYSKANFKYDGFVAEEQEANDGISSNLASAINVKVGGEVAVKVFRFRAGAGINQSPVEGDNTTNLILSAGAGLRLRSFFLDVAYRRYNINETYTPYLTSQAPLQLVDNTINNNKVMLTLGFKF